MDRVSDAEAEKDDRCVDLGDLRYSGGLGYGQSLDLQQTRRIVQSLELLLNPQLIGHLRVLTDLSHGSQCH